MPVIPFQQKLNIVIGALLVTNHPCYSRYDDNEDEKRGSNIMIIADEYFKNIEYKTIGEVVHTHGFSSFKFVPGSQVRIRHFQG